MDNNALKKGFNQARMITKHFAKTFYLAAFFLPKEKRLASYAVYSICRISDETVDSNRGNNLKNDLDKIRADIESAYSQNTTDNPPLLASFQQTVVKYKIPKTLFLELIDGMQMDLTKKRYENFDELYKYCYKAAGVVGLIMLQIFGSNDPETRDYAIKLGIAMQLTNILRDIKEDSARNRIYLPLDEIYSCGLSMEDIIHGRISLKFVDLMKKQINRAREFYQASQPGIDKITDKKAAFVITLMKDMYSGILNEIEINNYDVFSKRAHLNILKKILVILKAFRKRRN
jgi:phytoene synthase